MQQTIASRSQLIDQRRWTVESLLPAELGARAMTTSSHPIALLLMVLIASGCAGREPSAKEVAALAEDLNGLGFADTRAVIVRRFGQADRDIGSGAVIEQWDVFGGVLTLHGLGLSFTKDGVSQRLTKTTNHVGECLFGSYEMTTLSRDGLFYWLGNVQLVSATRYEFKDSEASLEQRDGQEDNFFMLHPDGTVHTDYAQGIDSTTSLEGLRVGQSLATLTFVARDAGAKASFLVVADSESMSLVIESDDPPFRMSTGFVHYWPRR